MPRPDDDRFDQPREPIFNLPLVITALIAVFLGIHAIREYALSFQTDIGAIRTFAFIPGRFLFSFDPAAVASELTRLASDSSRFQVARYYLGDKSMQPWTVVTYAFLHGDFVHATVNSVWLAIFGAPVARRIGALRFLALFVVTAIAGVALHFALHRLEFVPVVGASASVSGAMAAALRFVFQPGGPLGPAVPGWRLPPEFSARLPALPLRDVVRDRRVMQFILIWFAINLLFGLFSVQLGATSSAVAWEAHVGGFIAGFLLFQLFDPPPPDPEILAGFYHSRHL
ncbi:MAG: rhomboid family intramembrane serine protease [Hyphomicrobiales bacterium]|nr:rhomboid family intramembrane serine protease [Hyphomicrobiales bacterium]